MDASVCPHVSGIRADRCGRILAHPERWQCRFCGQSGEVSMCLACGYVGCSTHAEIHHSRRRHPLSMELHGIRKVWCRLCDAHVINDTRHGDLKLLRSVLDDVEQLHPPVARTRSGATSRGRRDEDYYTMGRDTVRKWRVEDKRDTAEAFRRGALRLKALRAWRDAAAHHASCAPPTLAFLTPETPPVSKRGRQEKTRKAYRLVPGKTGLRNLGNTCWANAVLQALSNTVPFRQYLLELHRDSRWENKLIEQAMGEPEGTRGGNMCFSTTTMNLRSQSYGSQKQGRDGPEQEVLISLELRNIMKDLWSGKWALVSPASLIAAIWSALPAFKGFRQHDAHEFFLFLMERVEQETVKGGIFSDQASKRTKLSPENAKDVSESQQGGVLEETFCGKTERVVKCTSCGRIFTREERFTEISLDMPPSEGKRSLFGLQRKAGSGVTLKECLECFTKEIMLPDYRCEGCGKLGATCQVKISKLPEVLCFHIQRLMWTTTKQEKITTHVHAPLKNLKMNPYCTSNGSDSHQSYSMVALITHKGLSFGTGHYESFCFNSVKNVWYLFNDSRVSECSESDVLNAEAYMLIYVRQNTFPDNNQGTARFHDARSE